MTEITYAKAGGPPSDWPTCRVTDLATGDPVTMVYEVNAEEGWLIRAALDADGKVQFDAERNDVRKERITGRFRIWQAKRP